MILFLPNAAFLSEVSRAIEIARALQARGVPVAFGTRGGTYEHLVGAAGFTATRLDPPLTPRMQGDFLAAILSMGPRTSRGFYTDDIPLATDHGGSFVPPVLSHGLCPVAVNPPDPNLAKLPATVQRWLANRAPAFIRGPVAQLNRHARERGVDTLPSMLGLMCGDLTLVTELPEVLGLTAHDLQQWTPHWPLRVRAGTTFRYTGPLYARLDLPVPTAVDAFLDGHEPVVYIALTSVTETFLRSSHVVMPRAAAAVIMGGQGSVQTAIASGTPFIGLPHHGEQELNVAVAERMGTAIRMSPAHAGTPTLQQAVTRLLNETHFANSATAAAAHYAGIDGGTLAADTIITWLQARSTTSP